MTSMIILDIFLWILRNTNTIDLLLQKYKLVAIKKASRREMSENQILFALVCFMAYQNVNSIVLYIYIFKLCMYMIWIATNFILRMWYRLLFVIARRNGFECESFFTVVSSNNKELKYCSFHCSEYNKKYCKTKACEWQARYFCFTFHAISRDNNDNVYLIFVSAYNRIKFALT